MQLVHKFPHSPRAMVIQLNLFPFLTEISAERVQDSKIQRKISRIQKIFLGSEFASSQTFCFPYFDYYHKICPFLFLSRGSLSFVFEHRHKGRRQKKNWDESVRLTDSGGGGGGGPHPPPRLTDSICEKFRTFFLLNMIPWYPKQILLHCEEAEKCIFDVFLLPF